MGKQWRQCQTLFFWAPKSLQVVTAAMKLKDAYHSSTLAWKIPWNQESRRLQSMGSLLLSPGSWCAQGSVCALQESVSPVLCKFWWLYGGVNVDLLQEGLCHTQVYCTQSPHSCSSPLLTHTSSGDTQTVLSQSLWGVWVLVHTRYV